MRHSTGSLGGPGSRKSGDGPGAVSKSADGKVVVGGGGPVKKGRRLEPQIAVRELFYATFSDIFDAFTELDQDGDGILAQSDFVEGVMEMWGGRDAASVTNEQLDELFRKFDSSKEGHMTVRDFLGAFQKKAEIKEDSFNPSGEGRFAGKGPDGAGREFDEVLFECKDDKGVMKFVAVPADMVWSDLLLKLRGKYGRPVAFMYESDGHPYTVKDERDWKLCLDSVEENFKKSGGGATDRAGHLEAFIVDLDPTKFAISTRPKKHDMIRTLLTPKRVVIADDPAGGAGGDADYIAAKHGAAASGRLVAPMDFAGKHQWIDEMMRKVGACGDDEGPTTMRGRWDKLLKECQTTDPESTRVITPEAFRKALKKVEAKMTAAQVDWFVRDSDKDESGDILYDKYCSSKRSGLNTSERHSMQDKAMMATEAQINEALQAKFRSLQQAFKRFDVDKDGALTAAEFKAGLEQRLHIKLAPKLLDAVFRRVDADNDGLIGYAEFLTRFKALPSSAASADGNHDKMPDGDVCKTLIQAYGTAAEAFKDMDLDHDGRLSKEELGEGLGRIGVRLSSQRLDAFLESMDIDGNKQIDYKEFLRGVSTVSVSDQGGKTDEMSREEARVRDKLRESFAEAKQAFHAFDKDKDGRLSEAEFIKGATNLFEEGGGGVKEALLVQLFRRADMDGDGFLAYHEFLSRYGVRPKMRTAVAVDEKIKAAIRKKYPNSSMQAFGALDMDQDGLLSKEDLKRGLSTDLGLKLTDSEVEMLLSRGDFDGDDHMDYYEFIVRFGLEFQAEGQWVYKTAETKVAVSDPEEVKVWRKLMPASKWHGRGGIGAVLKDYDVDRDNLLDRRQFMSALVDGLGMFGLGNEDVDKMLGAAFDRPWCDKAKKMVRVMSQDCPKCLVDKSSKCATCGGKGQLPGFYDDFVKAKFARELALFKVLLVDNKWLDLRHALESFDTTTPDEQPAITQVDFACALKRLVEKNAVSRGDADLIAEKVKADSLLEKDGPMAGMLLYRGNFLDKYIGDEMAVHAVIMPKWEACRDRFAAFPGASDRESGASLTYAQFRELSKQLHFSRPLSSPQIESLIDVLDRDGDGRVSTREFIDRYARDEARLLEAVRGSWKPLLALLLKRRRPEASPGCLARSDMVHVLMDAVDAGLLAHGLMRQDVPGIVAAIDPKLLAPSGEVRIEGWVGAYSSPFLQIHSAFQGKDRESGLPRWDTVISCFEIVDAAVQSVPAAAKRRPAGTVTWEEFRRAVERAGVVLGEEMLTKLVDYLDPGMAGFIEWEGFVEGRAPRMGGEGGEGGLAGEAGAAPYFFNGLTDLKVRRGVRGAWRGLLAKCREMDREANKGDKAKTGTIDRAGLERAFKEASPPAAFAADPSVVRHALDCFGTAFAALDPATSAPLKGKDGYPLVDYASAVRHYAGEAFSVEEQLTRKWEAILAALSALDTRGDGVVTRQATLATLARPELGLSGAMLSFLADGLGDPVRYHDLCWRFAQREIGGVLKTRSVSLLRILRGADRAKSGKVAQGKLEEALAHKEVGLSRFQAGLVCRQVQPGEDGMCDYEMMLQGRHHGLQYPAELYRAWRTLEANWERVAERFLSFDTNMDGAVSHAEFRAGVVQLGIDGLSESACVDLAIGQLDREGKGDVLFDEFMWCMARDALREALRECAVEVVEAFKGDAKRLAVEDAKSDWVVKRGEAPKHGGADLTRRETEAAVRRAAGDKISALQARVLVGRADAERRGMVGLVGLVECVRELAEDQCSDANVESFGGAVIEVLQTAMSDLREMWVDARGEDQVEAKKMRGVCRLGPEAMSFVGARGVDRGHMRGLIEGEGELPPGMRPSPDLCKIRDDRATKVYASAPWRSFWQEKQRVALAAPSAAAPLPAPAGVEEEHLEAATKRIKAALFERYDSVYAALRNLDLNSDGLLSRDELTKGLSDLRLGLTAAQIRALVARAALVGEGGGSYVLYQEFVDGFGTPESNLDKIRKERQSGGVYDRLRERIVERGEKDRDRELLAAREREVKALTIRSSFPPQAYPDPYHFAPAPNGGVYF